MRQQTLAAQASFEKYGRKSKREQFLDEMEEIVPWAELQGLVEAHYPKGENGRPPVGLSIMLRVYFLQQWFNLSDPGVEEALYESPVLRRFVGVDLASARAGREHNLAIPASAGTTRSGRSHAATGERISESRGSRISRGTIVDATILHAPSSTKNRNGERDPEMHQTRKGKQWYFGLKAHIGVDSKRGHVHSVCTSAAKHDRAAVAVNRGVAYAKNSHRRTLDGRSSIRESLIGIASVLLAGTFSTGIIGLRLVLARLPRHDPVPPEDREHRWPPSRPRKHESRWARRSWRRRGDKPEMTILG